jgi:uncharacterized protein YjbJ (UPF0337 family)
MTDQTGQPQPASVLATTWGKLISGLVIVAFLLGIATEGVTAYRTTKEAVTAEAVADNAAVRQKGEAEQAASEARTQLEIARNAAERQKAEADKAEAEATKADADAGTLDQHARNAELKARSDALSIKNEAEIRRYKAETALGEARAAATKFKAEADAAEANNIVTEKQLEMLLGSACWRACPGAKAIEKVAAKYEGRCR